MNDKLSLEKMLAESEHNFEPKKYKDMPYDYIAIDQPKDNTYFLQIAFHKESGKFSHFDIENEYGQEWQSR